MQGWHNLAGYRRLFILGAGFSAPAGLPLTNQLLPLVFRQAQQHKPLDGDPILGLAEMLLSEIKLFFPNIHLTPKQIVDGKIPKSFDFEKFLTYASVISASEFGTGNQLDAHGNPFISYLKNWTGAVIYDKQMQAMQNLPSVYDKFACLLCDSMVLTFNWDTLLEHSLAKANRQYNLDRNSYSKPPTTLLLKLHGSIDWFSKDDSLREQWMKLIPIGESLPEFARADDGIERLGKYFAASMSPWIILPSFDKMHQLLRYGELWQMLYLFPQNELDVYIVGFSMRPDDYHTFAMIYPQLVHGAREGRLKVKVIDLASTMREKNKIRKKFSGIRNCKFWFDGFSENSLDFIAS